MASLTKQQKRTKRAKAKAKQQRVARSLKPGLAAENDFFDFDAQDILPEHILGLFNRMKEAESISRAGMLVMLLASPETQALLEMEGMQLDENTDQTETVVSVWTVLLVAYRKWAHGIEAADTEKWMVEPDVLSDFEEAISVYNQAISAFENDSE